MKTLNDLRISETPPKQFKNKFIDEGYTYTLNNIKKTLLLDNLPKLMSIFGLSGFGFSIFYLLVCPICCPEKWIIAVFQIFLFGGIYYYGMKKSTPKL